MLACNIYNLLAKRKSSTSFDCQDWMEPQNKINSLVKGANCHAILSHFIMLKYVVFTSVETRKWNEVCLLKSKQLYWDCLLPSVVEDGKDRGGLYVERVSLSFLKFSYPTLRQNQKCTVNNLLLNIAKNWRIS